MKRRRKRLNPISEKRKKYQEELAEMLPALMARCNGICELCHAMPAQHPHHRLRRSQGGKNTFANIMMVCAADHRLIHDFPELSYAKGWLLRRNR